MISVLDSRYSFLLGGLSLWLMLDLGYRYFVNPVYYFAGFSLNFSWIKYAESFLFYFFFLLMAPQSLTRPSDFFLNSLLFGLMLPLFLFYGLSSQSREHLYIVVLGYIIIDATRRGRPIKLPLFKSGFRIACASMIIGTLLVTVWLVASGGAGQFNLDFAEVYEYRRTTGQVINKGFMAYLNVWVFKVFGPLLLALALWGRLYWIAVAVILQHVFWFGVSQHKAGIFSPLLVLFRWIWLRRTSALSVVFLALSWVILLSLLLYLWLGFSIPASLFIRRAFFVIANNAFDYYQFFSTHEYVYWSNSVLSSLLHYPYHIPPAELIGESRGTESHVNNTFLATGFMHAGVMGVVFYALLAGLLFRLIDSIASSGIPLWVALAALIVPSRSLLMSADFFTAILTHGVGVAVLGLFLLRRAGTGSLGNTRKLTG